MAWVRLAMCEWFFLLLFVTTSTILMLQPYCNTCCSIVCSYATGRNLLRKEAERLARFYLNLVRTVLKACSWDMRKGCPALDAERMERERKRKRRKRERERKRKSKRGWERVWERGWVKPRVRSHLHQRPCVPCPLNLPLNVAELRGEGESERERKRESEWKGRIEPASEWMSRVKE